MNDEIFSTLEVDTIGEIMNISMGSAATAASTLLDNKVSITTPIVNVVDFETFEIKVLEPAIAVEIQYVEGISGSNILLLRQSDAIKILSQMMQSELPEDYVLDEMAKSAICELMNQMMGSSATVLSCFLGRSINISTPITVPIEEWGSFKEEHLPNEQNLLTIKFTLSIDTILDSEFISVMDIGLAKEIIAVSLNFDSDSDPVSSPEPAAPAPAPAAAPPPPPAYQAPPPASPPAYQAPPASPPAYQAPPYQPVPAAPPMAPPGYPAGPPAAAYPPPYPYPPYPQPPAYGGWPPPQTADPVLVKNYAFNDFADNSGVTDQPHNLDLVMNVPVTVTVELGRTRRKIKEILEFGQGTIVELDKQAGSQVDVIVNGQMVARGDVVVVDDNFSIRITEILKARDSLSPV
jgi:flagellar motor switch protein FliN/FliY